MGRTMEELEEENQRLKKEIEKLWQLVSRDPLTGLYNRHYVMNYLMDRLQEARIDTNIVVAMGDVDDFKMINDIYSHEAGDVTLLCISDILQEYGRMHYVIRWGGEEFLIVFVGISEVEAHQLLHEMKEEIIAYVFEQDGVQYNCTMTFGMTSLMDGDTMEEAIERADAALYRGKQSGKNCIIWENDHSEKYLFEN